MHIKRADDKPLYSERNNHYKQPRRGKLRDQVSRWQPLFFEVVPLDFNRIMSFVAVETHHLWYLRC
jgi:hypothetical protein